jgi:hypothetical protein
VGVDQHIGVDGDHSMFPVHHRRSLVVAQVMPAIRAAAANACIGKSKPSSIGDGRARDPFDQRSKGAVAFGGHPFGLDFQVPVGPSTMRAMSDSCTAFRAN